MILRGQRRVTTTVAAAGLAVLTIASCSSSKSSPKTTPPPTSQVTTPSGTAGGPPPTIDAATVAAVKNAYVTFFDPKTPQATSMGLLQDGTAFKAALEEQAKGTFAQNASATVAKVTLQSPNTAKVVFSILVSGKVTLAGQPGYAVHEDGTWKVAGQTFCGLLTLEGSVPAACNTPAATDLPN
jgi:hypothetical protein